MQKRTMNHADNGNWILQIRGDDMGCVNTITAHKFPKQSEYVNRRCKVCFHYDTTKWIMGTVIRDDREEPFETLIQLNDGRTIRGVECQYSFSLNA